MIIGQNNFEMLKLNAFACKLGFSRSTIYSMIRSGDLVEGIHYIVVGKRGIRFFWNKDAALLLSRRKNQGGDNNPTTISEKPIPKGARIRLRR